MHINAINSLNTKNIEINAENHPKFYAYKAYGDLTEKIFNIQKSTPGKSVSMKGSIAPKDEPFIDIVNQIAKVLFQIKSKETGIHSHFANLVNDLQNIKKTLHHKDRLYEEYTENLIDACISEIKKEGVDAFEKKSFELIKLPEDQYENLLKQGEQLDKFFKTFEKFSTSNKIDEDPFKEFIRVWTLCIDKLFTSSSKKRTKRMMHLQKSKNQMEGLESNQTLETVKAHLNFMLAMTLLAQELKKSSPNQEEITKARELLKESAPYSEPAKIALNYDFGNAKLKPKEMKKEYKKLEEAIQASGCEKFIEQYVGKKDLKDLFKMMSPKTMKKEKVIHALKIIAAIITLPIAWTAALIMAILGILWAILTSKA